MRSPIAPLLTAGILVEGDLWRIAPFVTAVNPAKLANVRSWAVAQGQLSYVKWLDRGYAATHHRVGPTRSYAVIAKTADGTFEPPHIPRLLARSVLVTESIYTGGPHTRDVSTAPDAVIVIRKTRSHASFSPETLTQCDLLYSKRMLFSEPYGAPRNVAIPPIGTVSVFTNSASYSDASIAGTYLTAALPSYDSRGPQKGWPLIDGPGVLTRGEIALGNPSGAPPLVSFVFATADDIADYMDGTSATKTTRALESIAQLRAAPDAGAMVLWPGLEVFNPFELMPQLRAVATEAWDEADVPGVDMAAARTRWGDMFDSGDPVIGAWRTVSEPMDYGTVVVPEKDDDGIWVGAIRPVIIDGLTVRFERTEESGVYELVTMAGAAQHISSLQALSVPVMAPVFGEHLTSKMTSDDQLVKAKARLEDAHRSGWAVAEDGLPDEFGDVGCIGRALFSAVAQPLTTEQQMPHKLMLLPGALREALDWELPLP